MRRVVYQKEFNGDYNIDVRDIKYNLVAFRLNFSSSINANYNNFEQDGGVAYVETPSFVGEIRKLLSLQALYKFLRNNDSYVSQCFYLNSCLQQYNQVDDMVGNSVYYTEFVTPICLSDYFKMRFHKGRKANLIGFSLVLMYDDSLPLFPSFDFKCVLNNGDSGNLIADTNVFLVRDNSLYLYLPFYDDSLVSCDGSQFKLMDLLMGSFNFMYAGVNRNELDGYVLPECHLFAYTNILASLYIGKGGFSVYYLRK